MNATAQRVLFNATNLHVGGGVQVAVSLATAFLEMVDNDQLVRRFPWMQSMDFEVSSEVAANLPLEPAVRERVSIRDSTVWAAFALNRWKQHPYDLEFVVFGPRYGRRRGATTVSGIADGTSVFPRPAGLPRGSVPSRVRGALRGVVSRRIFRHEDSLVSESRALADAFCSRSGFPRDRIAVVPNVVNQQVVDPSLWARLDEDLRLLAPEADLLLAYVARLYPHKNHNFLIGLHAELRSRGINAQFVVTLSEQEWASCSPELRAVCVNVGIVPVNQLADLYMQCDAGLFPSLLESFSATPIEVVATNGLLFASDRAFVRETCGDAAVYFDPLDPASAASSIVAVSSSVVKVGQLRRNARRLAADLPTSETRALAFIEILDRALTGGRHPSASSGERR